MGGASPQQIRCRAARAGVAGLEIWAQQAETFGWQPEALGEMARRAGLSLAGPPAALLGSGGAPLTDPPCAPQPAAPTWPWGTASP